MVVGSIPFQFSVAFTDVGILFNVLHRIRLLVEIRVVIGWVIEEPHNCVTCGIWLPAENFRSKGICSRIKRIL